MISFLKKLKSTLEAPFLFILYAFLSLFPLSLLRKSVGFIAKTLGPLFPVTHTAQENLEACFPENTQEENKTLIKKTWESLGKIAAEVFYIDQIIKDKTAFQVENAHYISALQERKTGAILFSAHLGNWELCYADLLHKKIPISLIARRQRNPFAEWLINKKRKKHGIEMLSRTPSGSRKLVRNLKNGGYVGALFDIYDSDGKFLPFFSRPAKTSLALARIALRLEYPLIPTQVIRTSKETFIIRYHAPLEPKSYTTPENMMEHVNEIIEGWIRENPSQWLWFHRRWKIKKKDWGQIEDKTKNRK